MSTVSDDVTAHWVLQVQVHRQTLDTQQTKLTERVSELESELEVAKQAKQKEVTRLQDKIVSRRTHSPFSHLVAHSLPLFYHPSIKTFYSTPFTVLLLLILSGMSSVS